jgi:hypothetical protein
MLKIIAQRDNLMLTGKLQPCSACLLYKASQRPVKKDTLMKATHYTRQVKDQSRKDTLMKATYAGERIHMDV